MIIITMQGPSSVDVGQRGTVWFTDRYGGDDDDGEDVVDQWVKLAYKSLKVRYLQSM